MRVLKQPLRIPVSLAWAGPVAQQVEVIGDFPDWKYPVPMKEIAPGRYRCELELEPGVYRYKFRVDQRLWVRDPFATAVDNAEGYGNSLLIVGGARPPLYFAPDRQHVANLEDGRVLFHLEVGGGDRSPSQVWVEDPSKPSGRSSAPLELVAQRGDWRLLRAEVRLASPPRQGTAFGFTGLPEQVFGLPAPRPSMGRPPDWFQRAVLYTIFIDRWHRSARSPALPGARPRSARSTAQTFYGGDLDGIRESLPYLKDLGVDTLVLTPVHLSPTPHRYDATDLTVVDPAIGGEAALLKLLKAVHAKGLRLVLDVAVTHVNEQHAAFQDLLVRQEKSKYVQWFRVRRFPVRARDGETFDYYYDRPELPWLNLEPGSPARRHVLKVVEQMAGWGADGLRLDAMNDAPGDFWLELRARARARNPEMLLFGEVVSDTPARFAEERGVDAATDFRHREAMLAFFGQNSIGAAEFWERVVFEEFRTGPFDPTFHLLFLDNHDTARFQSASGLYDRLRLALTYLMVRPEPVALTYGTEHALSGGFVPSQLDDAWPERLPMPSLDGKPGQTMLLLRELAHLRKTLPALQSPALRLVSATGPLLVLERSGGGQRLWACLNASDEPVAMPELPRGARVVLRANEGRSARASTLGPQAARWLVL